MESTPSRSPWTVAVCLATVITGATACAHRSDEAGDLPGWLDGLDADLGPGASGDGVRAVQAYLVRHGYLSGGDFGDRVTGWRPVVEQYPTIGVYDGATTEAVRRLQDSLGIPDTGVVDAAMRQVLRSPRCSVPELRFAISCCQGGMVPRAMCRAGNSLLATSTPRSS